MSTNTKYTTASGRTLPELDALVTRLLREGDRLYGNPYAATNREEWIFCQAIVREDGESMREQIERAVVSERPEAILPIPIEMPPSR